MAWDWKNPLNIIPHGETKYTGFTKLKNEITRIYAEILNVQFGANGHKHTGADEDGAKIGPDGIDTTKQFTFSDIIAKGPWIDVRAFGAKGDGVTDDTTAIQAAVTANSSVFIPPGNYIISSPIFITGEKKSIIGAGKSNVTLTAKNGFVGATRNGHTVTTMIWYEVDSGQWNSGAHWTFGGVISGMTLQCGGYCEGVHLNRVCNGEVLENIAIYNPTTGINCSYTGWSNSINNAQVFGAAVASINLNGACNGVTMNGCELYGNGYNTPAHLVVSNNSYGVLFNGGVIEGCDVGAGVSSNSQLTIIGTDIEACTLLFGQVTDCTDSISSIIGCSFVGTPVQSAIAVNNGQLSTQGNSFVGGSGAVPCLCQSGTGYISERDNVYGSWTSKFSGNVYTKFDSGQLKFPATQRPSTDTNTLDDYREGSYTPSLLFGGSNTGMSYAIQTGGYTKIGNLVTGTFSVNKYTKGSATGDATITLPFTATENGSATITRWVNMASVILTVGYIAKGTNYISLLTANNTTTANLTDAAFLNNTDNIIVGTFTYFA